MRLVLQNKKCYLPLLLLADPEEAMIDRYLEEGELWVWEEKGECLAVAVVVGAGKSCELKNLAVETKWQGQGYGSMVVRALAKHYAQAYQTMLVGTSASGVAFYERLGFVVDHVVPGFFTDNYTAPIWENGCLCVDMIYLRLALR